MVINETRLFVFFFVCIASLPYLASMTISKNKHGTTQNAIELLDQSLKLSYDRALKNVNSFCCFLLIQLF